MISVKRGHLIDDVFLDPLNGFLEFAYGPFEQIRQLIEDIVRATRCVTGRWSAGGVRQVAFRMVQGPVGSRTVLALQRRRRRLIVADGIGRAGRDVRPRVDLFVQSVEQVGYTGLQLSNPVDRTFRIQQQDLLHNSVRAQNILPLKDKSKPLDEIFKKHLDLVEDKLNGPHHCADAVHHHLVQRLANLDEKVPDVFGRVHKPLFDVVQDTHEPVPGVLPKQHEGRFVAGPQGWVGGGARNFEIGAEPGDGSVPFVELTRTAVVGNAPDPCRPRHCPSALLGRAVGRQCLSRRRKLLQRLCGDLGRVGPVRHIGWQQVMLRAVGFRDLQGF